MTDRQSRKPNEAMHRMSGTHMRLRSGCHKMPLIGDLRRSAAKGQKARLKYGTMHDL
jgi:hypothetical protein